MFSLRHKISYGIAALAIIIAALFLLKKKSNVDITPYRDFSEIKKSGRLNVVTYGSSFDFQAKNGQLTGFNYDVVKAFADSMGLELVVSVQNNLDSCIEDLDSEKCDIIAVCLPTTTQLQERLAFTTPLFTTRQMLVQQAFDDSVVHQTLSDQRFLSQDSICIPAHSPHKPRLQSLSNEIAKEIKIVEIKGKTTEELVKMVAAGEIKYTICDELQARKLKQTYPNIDIELPIGFNQPVAWGVHPRSKKLLYELDRFLKYFLISTDYWGIYRKYF